MDKIESSPKYGLYMNKTCKILLIFAVILALIIVLFSIVCIIVYAIEDGLNESVLGTYIPILLVGVFASTLFLYFFIRQCIFEKKLKLWEKDFIKLYAKVEAGYTVDKIIGGITVGAIFKFRYEKQEHIIKGGPLSDRFGETKTSKLIGQKVPIYYSPTYDEVVFIKEVQEQ